MRRTSLLLLLLALAGPVAGQDPADPDPVEVRWQEASRRAHEALGAKRFDEAARLFEDALEIAGEGPLAAESAYNAACSHARAGRTETALDRLERSVALGFLDLDHIETDPDLDSLRGESRYAVLVASLSWNDVVAVRVPEGAPAGELPVLVALHPERRSEKDVLDLLGPLAAGHGVVLVAPRAPFTIGEGRFAWKRDPTDDAAARRKIAAALDAAARAHPIDRRRVTLLGLGSRAGYLAWLSALSEPARWPRLVVVDGWFNRFHFPDLLAGAREGNRGILLLHAAGSPDLANARDAAARLEKAGFAIEIQVQTRSGLPERGALAPVGEFLDRPWGE